ncbi:19-kda spindle pole component protein, putative [Candida dubliniensis CD36]|uniref:DASH complex subunit SPC19 n=1 Tax=Candida dubliniensis (strain CD36 / ATCC MYA-646 / CBS 7987 / NCPF 3949 / NRRL Y-17841) TaxID=573826 RepID=B9W7H0_CANDC|nr:19-kda spindle pole component protein, putative [Candida dubliniensis CD36]CAX44630.1 19-kda spindle pole component protein, putative [Candida dubliniensis CD36]
MAQQELPQQNQRFNNLDNCTDSLRQSIKILQQSNKLLDETLQDSTRLIKILSTNKVFDLIPELDLNDAKSNFTRNITPQLNQQLNKLEDELIRLQTNKTTLTNKLKLINVRLKNYQRKSNGNDHDGDDDDEEGGGGRVRGRKNFNSSGLSDVDIDNLLINRHKNGYDANKLHQLRFLRDKKTRLQYSLNRLS